MAREDPYNHENNESCTSNWPKPNFNYVCFLFICPHKVLISKLVETDRGKAYSMWTWYVEKIKKERLIQIKLWTNEGATKTESDKERQFRHLERDKRLVKKDANAFYDSFTLGSTVRPILSSHCLVERCTSLRHQGLVL